MKRPLALMGAFIESIEWFPIHLGDHYPGLPTAAQQIFVERF